MLRYKLILSGSIVAMLVLVVALLCTLPLDPKDPSNTRVSIVLRTTDKTETSFIEDSAGNRIRIGVVLRLPENIDSVNLKVIHGTIVVLDTMFKDILPGSDTLWKDIIFYTEGLRTVTVTPYSSLGLSSPSASIKIIGKKFPENHAPELTVSGSSVIKPSETCSLTINISDIDSGQELSVFMANNPAGSQLIKNNTQFVWTAPADFIGKDTVTFTVIDNGKPPLSARLDVIITVTATPHPPKITVKGDLTIAQLETCSLTISVSDDDAGQTLRVAMSGQPDGAQLVEDTIFIWTAPADFIGKKVVTFTVTDNGEPAFSSSAVCTIIVSAATVNSAPKWDARTISVQLKDTAKYVKNLTDICHDADGDRITFTLAAGAPAGDTIIGTTYLFHATSLLIGTYKVRIIAFDPKGASDTLTIDITVTSSSAVDATPPTITLVNPPKDSLEISTPEYRIYVIASDASGIASVTATFGGVTLIMEESSGGNYTVTMKGLNAGEYNRIDIVATDGSPAGNKTTKSVYLKYSQRYKLTYDGNGNTGGTVPVDTMSYAAGAIVTVRANSGNLIKTGSTFAGWNTTADGKGISYAPGETFAMGSADDTLFAVWSSKPTFTLTVSATNGSVMRSPDLPAYDSGTVVTLTPVPSANYHFSGWSGALTGSASPATITMDGAKTVTAVFELNQPNSFALTVLATNGTVTKNPDLPQYDSGSTVSLTATPAPGYQFSGWSGALNGSTNPASIIMNEAKTVTANFTLLSVTLTLTNDGHGTTSPTSTVSGSYNVPINISATPATGYSFSNWTVTVGSTNATFASATTASTTVTLTGDATIRANFTANPVTLTITNNGNGTTNPSGTVSGTYNNPIAIQATAAPRYGFSGWTVTAGAGNVTFGNASSATTTVTLTGDATIRANFIQTAYRVVYDGNGQTGGSAPVDNTDYPSGSTATIKPNSGGLIQGSYSFVGWENNSTAEIYECGKQVTITGDLNLKARYSFDRVMDNDGNVYTSIVIGTRRWLLQNLKTSKYRDGSSIYEVTNGTAWTTRIKSQTSDVCAWADFSGTQSQFGRLYNWSAVQREIAPAGWRIATQADWENLYSQANSNACQIIADWGGTCSSCPGEINATGFSLLESGYIAQFDNEPGYWSNSGAYVWVSNPSRTYVSIFRARGGVGLSFYDIRDAQVNPLGYGCVIRCVKD